MPKSSGHCLFLGCPGGTEKLTYLPQDMWEVQRACLSRRPFASLIGVELDSRSVYDGGMTKISASERIRAFLSEHISCSSLTLLIVFAGHGDPTTGNWQFSDGCLDLCELLDLVKSASNEVIKEEVDDSMGATNICKHIFILADCCSSGRWVDTLQAASHCLNNVSSFLDFADARIGPLRFCGDPIGTKSTWPAPLPKMNQSLPAYREVSAGLGRGGALRLTVQASSRGAVASKDGVFLKLWSLVQRGKLGSEADDWLSRKGLQPSFVSLAFGKAPSSSIRMLGELRAVATRAEARTRLSGSGAAAEAPAEGGPTDLHQETAVEDGPGRSPGETSAVKTPSGNCGLTATYFPDRAEESFQQPAWNGNEAHDVPENRFPAVVKNFLAPKVDGQSSSYSFVPVEGRRERPRVTSTIYSRPRADGRAKTRHAEALSATSAAPDEEAADAAAGSLGGTAQRSGVAERWLPSALAVSRPVVPYEGLVRSRKKAKRRVIEDSAAEDDVKNFIHRCVVALRSSESETVAAQAALGLSRLLPVDNIESTFAAQGVVDAAAAGVIRHQRLLEAAEEARGTEGAGARSAADGADATSTTPARPHTAEAEDVEGGFFDSVRDCFAEYFTEEAAEASPTGLDPPGEEEAGMLRRAVVRSLLQILDQVLCGGSLRPKAETLVRFEFLKELRRRDGSASCLRRAARRGPARLRRLLREWDMVGAL